MAVDNWYEYPSNFSSGTKQINDTISFLEYGTAITGGYFGIIILFLTYMITFTSFMISGSKKSFLASSFITLMVSIYLFQLQLITNFVWIGVLIVMVIVGAISTMYSKGSY